MAHGHRTRSCGRVRDTFGDRSGYSIGVDATRDRDAVAAIDLTCRLIQQAREVAAESSRSVATDGWSCAIPMERSVIGCRWIWLEGRTRVAVEQLGWPAGCERRRPMWNGQRVDQAARGCRVGHDRDDRATSATAAVVQVVREHPLEKLGPRHTARAPHRDDAGVGAVMGTGHWDSSASGGIRGRHQATELLALAGRGSEDPVVSNQVSPRRRDDPAQPAQHGLGLERQRRATVMPRPLQPIRDPPIVGPREPILCECWPRAVPTQPLEPGPIGVRDRDRRRPHVHVSGVRQVVSAATAKRHRRCSRAPCAHELMIGGSAWLAVDAACADGRPAP